MLKKYEVSIVNANSEAVTRGDFVFINVPPQVLSHIIKELSELKLSEDKLLVTLAAGVPINRFNTLGDIIPIVRALPNPPSQMVGAMELRHHRQVPPYELMAEASTPEGVSAESLFTLDKYTFPGRDQ